MKTQILGQNCYRHIQIVSSEKKIYIFFISTALLKKILGNS